MTKFISIINNVTNLNIGLRRKMTIEKREFFRFDVTLPFYLEARKGDAACFQVTSSQVVSQSQKQRIDALNQSIDSLLHDAKHVDNGSVEMFASLNNKIEFFAWLLQSLINNNNVLLLDKYQQYLHEQLRFIIPSSNKSSKVLPLLQALSNRIDLYIDELSQVMKHCVSGHVFICNASEVKPFNVRHYIGGLESLAQKGNWLAKIIIDLTQKLNTYEGVLDSLKKQHNKLSDTDSWPHEKVNLGEGGLAVFSQQNFTLNQEICVLLKLDETLIFAKAKCVYQTKLSDELRYNRTAFEFQEISSEDSAHIVRYLMAQELAFHQVRKD